MRLPFFAFLIIFVSSCSQTKELAQENRFTEREMNLRAIITILKHANPECTGSCNFKIHSKLNFFHDGLIEEKHNIFEQKYDTSFSKKKVIDYLIYKYDIPDLGNLVFAKGKESNIMFTPLIITENQEMMVGMVRYPNGAIYNYCVSNITNEFVVNYYRQFDDH
ncbi:MAG: hypothetical protein HKN51_10345 [Saprospiraceae bacterium]|nr:hypothetical protein [Saprospiraceae bacterium]